MKKRIIFLLFSVVMIVTLSVAFIACNKGGETVTYEISFDFNSGQAAEGKAEDFAVQTVEDGGYAARPASEPVRSGYVFDGWYKSLAGEPFDFADEKITSDIQLIAGWVSAIPQLPVVTVSFDLGGGSGAPAHFINQIFESGKKVKQPLSNPERIGYVFKGWVDASGDEFDFDKEIITETAVAVTVKAKWNALVTVEFDLDGGKGSAAAQSFEPGGNPTKPSIDPTKESCVFKGWVDSTGNAFNFNAAITSSVPLTVTVKAKWAVLVTVKFDLGEGVAEADKEEDFEDQIFEAGGKAVIPASDPALEDFEFDGYVDANGEAFDFTKAINPDEPVVITVYAKWDAIFGIIYFDSNGGEGGQAGEVRAHYEEAVPAIEVTPPLLSSWTFAGWFDTSDEGGNQYYSAEGVGLKDMPETDLTLYARWVKVTSNPEAIVIKTDTHKSSSSGRIIDVYIEGGGSGNYSYAAEISAPSRFTAEKKATTSGADADATFVVWCVGSLTSEVISDFSIIVTDLNYGVSFFVSIYVEIPGSEPPACVAEGTLITLADGSMVPVEQLTGEELLLVWNMFTGEFDAAPITFIDSDPVAEFKIIHLYFSDGSEVKIIYEHGFWDFDLNKYVFINNQTKDDYVGHWFQKHITDEDDNLVWTKVQLINVEVYVEVTTAWSPITIGHLNFYVNGVLSVPAGNQGFVDIFNVIAEEIQIDEDAYLADIEEYGLYTYEEFIAIRYVPEFIFEAYQGRYFKIAIGKGILDWETLNALIDEFSRLWEDTEETE